SKIAKQERRMEMGKKALWKISTAGLVLIPVAVGINYVGKTLASLLKLPLWLDSIGTVLGSMLAGPVIGAISGMINNIIYGFTLDPVSTVYFITSLAIGLVVGILSYRGWLKSFPRVLGLGLIVGVVSSIVSTPLNIIYWEGLTGNFWGDALFAYVIHLNAPLWLASFLDSIVVDVPDKLLTVLIGYFIYIGLPKNIKQLFADDEIEEL
ncbi:MAG: ECF transporter S component, partial [Bacillaceae bacterium]